MPTSKAGWVQVLGIIKQWVVFTVEVRVRSSFITSDRAHWGIWVQGGLTGAQPGAHHHIAHLHFRPSHGTRRSSITLLRWQEWGRLSHWCPAWGALHIYKRKNTRSKDWIMYSMKAGQIHLQLTDFTEKQYTETQLSFFFILFYIKGCLGLFFQSSSVQQLCLL